MIARTASPARVAAMYSRSAAGSSTWPRRLCWFHARASLPSSQSDTPAAISRPTAHQSACGTSTSHRNTGTPASRAMLITFGTVRTRSTVALGSLTRWRSSLASVLPQGGDALTDADAHGGRRPAGATPAQLVQQGGGDAGAGAAERVADGDRAAVDVQPV